jgi:hypothetical protein
MERHEHNRSRLVFALPAMPALVLVIAAVAVLRNSDWDRLVVVAAQEIEPLLRTVIIGMLASVVVTLISVSMAIVVIGPWLRLGRRAIFAVCVAVPLAITPLLLGAASFAFLWQDPFADALLRTSWIFERGSSSVAIVDIVAQAARYVPIATWLLILIVLGTTSTVHWYAKQAGLRPTALVRVEFVRQWMPPMFIVAAFAFQDAFNDYIITYLSLRPSPATHTELISHFLNRSFVSIAVGRSAAEASSALVGLSIISGIVSAAAFGFITLALAAFIRAFHVKASTERTKPFFEEGISARLQSTLTWALVAAAAAIVLSLMARIASLGMIEVRAIWELRTTLLASLAVALTCWCLAMFINFTIRESTSNNDGSAQRSFTALIWICVSVGFVPPLGLAAAVYVIVFYSGIIQLDASISWFAGQVLRMFPLFVVLVVPASLAVDDGPIWYVRTAGLSYIRRLYILFVAPFKTTHLALLLIGWNFVLNEGVISTVFQADIPALSEIVQRASSGRSAAYPIAASISALNAVVFGVLCLLWGLQSYRLWAKAHAGN